MLHRGDHACLSPWLLLRKHPLLCCALYSVFGLGAKSSDDGFGARSTRVESGYSGPEQFLSVFLLRLLLFPNGERKSCPCCYLTRRESIWGVRGAAAHTLNLGSRWGWVVSSTTLLLYVRPRWTEGCVGPGAGLNALEKSDLLPPTRILQSSSPVFQPLITLTFKSHWSLRSTLCPRSYFAPLFCMDCVLFPCTTSNEWLL